LLLLITIIIIIVVVSSPLDGGPLDVSEADGDGHVKVLVDADGLLAATADEVVAVGGERHCCHPRAVVADRVHQLSRRHQPQPHCLVPRRRRKQPVVAAQRYAVHRPPVLLRQCFQKR